MIIEILGAGISGLASAVNLSKAGYKVSVYEKNKKIGEKYNHNICALRNYNLNEDAIEELNGCGVNIEPNNKVKKVLRYSPNFCSELRSKKPIFYLVKRGQSKNSIENQLFSQINKNNADFIFNSKKTSADVIATGPEKTDIYGYGFVFKDLNIENAVYLFYDNRYAPGGFVCILPSKKEALILSVCFKKESFPELPSLFENSLKENKVLCDIVNKSTKIEKISGYGNYKMPSSCKKDNKYYIGEAAGFQDASKGFGIRYAIISAYLASRSIIENKDFYDTWRGKLKKELEDNLKTRKFLNNVTNSDYDKIVRKLGPLINLDDYVEKRRETV